jgi:hypothetical protein
MTDADAEKLFIGTQVLTYRSSRLVGLWRSAWRTVASPQRPVHGSTGTSGGLPRRCRGRLGAGPSGSRCTACSGPAAWPDTWAAAGSCRARDHARDRGWGPVGRRWWPVTAHGSPLASATANTGHARCRSVATFRCDASHPADRRRRGFHEAFPRRVLPTKCGWSTDAWKATDLSPDRLHAIDEPAAHASARTHPMRAVSPGQQADGI